MTESEIRKWEETRVKGKMNFVLTQGIAFGGIMAVVTGFFTYLFDRENPEIWKVVLFQSLSWIPFGFLYSIWLWWFGEKRYKKYKK